MTTVGVRQRLGLEPSGETAQQRQTRLDSEASMLAAAKVAIEQGRYIADGDLDAWLAAWENGEPVALPEAPSHSPRS